MEKIEFGNITEKFNELLTSVGLKKDDGSSDKKQTIFTDRYSEIHATPAAQYEGVITKDIVVDGSITCGSNLKIAGVVNGNVSCVGNVEINNCVKGDVAGRQVALFGANITGNIKAEETLRLEGGVVTGNIEALNADVDGAVNGDIKVRELLTIKKGAVINGNIYAATVSMAKRAVINGQMSINSQD